MNGKPQFCSLAWCPNEESFYIQTCVRTYIHIKRGGREGEGEKDYSNSEETGEQILSTVYMKTFKT